MRLVALALTLCASLALGGCVIPPDYHDHHRGPRYDRPAPPKKGWEKPKPPHHEAKPHKAHRPDERRPGDHRPGHPQGKHPR